MCRKWLQRVEARLDLGPATQEVRVIRAEFLDDPAVALDRAALAGELRDLLHEVRGSLEGPLDRGAPLLLPALDATAAARRGVEEADHLRTLRLDRLEHHAAGQVGQIVAAGHDVELVLAGLEIGRAS